MAFSSDGKHVLSGSDDETVRVWNVGSQRCVALRTARKYESWQSVFSTMCVEYNVRAEVSETGNEIPVTWDGADLIFGKGSVNEEVLATFDNCVSAFAVSAEHRFDSTIDVTEGDSLSLKTLRTHLFSKQP